MSQAAITKVIIDHALGLLRIDNFLDKKDLLDQAFHIDHLLGDHSRYRIKEFKKLLHNIQKDVGADNTGGMRVYFASKDDDENQITLIYTPVHNKNIDIEKYYTMDEGGYLINLDKTTANTWVTQYQTVILPILQGNGFIETKSIVYTIDSVSELLDFINAHTIKNLIANFAAYLPANSPYIKTFNSDDDHYPKQLTLIFTLRGPDINLDNSLSNKHVIVILGGASGDTGNPCPPPKDKPCPGSSLPI
ncbi:MAG: hypothetical protein JST21_02010 [Bacteroidetes bacterium]|nr:hypothetical protein [Bacteroidota bacterium]